MKKIITILFCLSIVIFQANAQQWVSTTPQPRNVVLEEFTGIHCGFCPDGHKKANDLEKAYPGKVFLVNIHAGSFATPQAGEPDLRTTEGTAIDAAAGVTGYPSGSVNRSTVPWGKDRGTWAQTASAIMAQTSPVNVAVKSSVDFDTRTVTTEVEIYYTSNSARSTNYLSVMLTQDDIIGYQSDYGNYNPNYWTPDGKYRHMHAFRQMITSGGAFGEVIDTTTAGHYQYKKFVTVLPANIKSIDLVLYKLNVVAFVSETSANILSAAGTAVEYDPSLKFDLGLKNLTEFPTSYCFTEVHPIIEVTNNSNKTVTGFDVSLLLNTAETKKTFNGTLAPNEKTTIDWGIMPFAPVGTYSIKIQGFSNVNSGALADMDFSNDAVSFSGLGFKQKAFTSVLGGFNTTAIPSNFALDKSVNTAFQIVTQSNPPIGANNTNGAIRYALHESWGMNGKKGEIIFGEADFTTVASPGITFWYAYSDDAYGGTVPTIKVYVSEDCGTNWIDFQSITPTQTGAPATHGNWYIPVSSEYKKVTVDLNAYKNKSVLLKLSGTPGTGGNALYIDEVAVGEVTVAVEEETITENGPAYPNPAETEIRLSDSKLIGKSFSVFSVEGVQVISSVNTDNKIDVSKLSPGTYYIRINNEIIRFIKL